MLDFILILRDENVVAEIYAVKNSGICQAWANTVR